MNTLFSLLTSHGITPQDSSLYLQAITHRSATNEKKSLGQDNERLEFLGDAVLELVVTEHLYQHLPDVPEGDMTRIRSSIVKGTSLAKKAREIGLSEVILMSQGEIMTKGHHKSSILANTLEALIGAIYLDLGMPAAKSLITDLLLTDLPDPQTLLPQHDPKSAFQEWSQGVRGITPEYRHTEFSGPEHARTYHAQVWLGSEYWGTGQGSSKQKAEVSAARQALQKLSSEDQA